MGEGLAVFESVRDEDVANISLTFRGSQLAALLLQVDNEVRKTIQSLCLCMLTGMYTNTHNYTHTYTCTCTHTASLVHEYLPHKATC